MIEKYVLILSDEDDISTNDVIDWLDYYGYKVLRINEVTRVYCNYFELDENDSATWSISIDGKEYKSAEVLNYWYRRGVLVFEYEFLNLPNPVMNRKLNTYLNHENNGVYKLFNSYLGRLPNKIGNSGDNYISKGNVLQLAAKCGLRIPKTMITTRRSDLLSFAEKHDFVITKAISEGVAADINGEFKINGFTTIVDTENMDAIPEQFFPTLFQEGLSKKWEIRTFFLNGKMYSTAIFSQRDETTKVDFRHYGKKFPNRTPPYELPEKIKESVIMLMKGLRMQSGSLDFVYTTNNEYVFLEVNPVGQFAQVSDPCNFYLSEKIALELVK